MDIITFRFKAVAYSYKFFLSDDRPYWLV